MLKIEQKIIEFIDKYLSQILFFVLVFIALYMRKATLYHKPFDMELSFYAEKAGYIHTAFYTQCINWITLLPIVAIITLKIVISVFDILLAITVAYYLGGKRGMWETRSFTCLGLLLISPLVIEYGVVWLRIDSICMFLTVCALLCFEKKKYVFMSLLFAIAVALQVQYIIVVLGFGILCWKKREKMLIWLVGSVVAALALNVMAMLLLNLSWTDGLFSMIKWLVVDAGTGGFHINFLGWLSSIVGQYGYILGIGSMILAFKTRKYWKTAIIVNTLVILFVGGILQYGYWWSV